MALAFASFMMHVSYGVGFNQFSLLFHWPRAVLMRGSGERRSSPCVVKCAQCGPWWGTQGLSKRSVFDRPCAALAWTSVPSSSWLTFLRIPKIFTMILLLTAMILLIYSYCNDSSHLIFSSSHLFFFICFSRPFPGDGQSPGRPWSPVARHWCLPAETAGRVCQAEAASWDDCWGKVKHSGPSKAGESS